MVDEQEFIGKAKRMAHEALDNVHLILDHANSYDMMFFAGNWRRFCVLCLSLPLLPADFLNLLAKLLSSHCLGLSDKRPQAFKQPEKISLPFTSLQTEKYCFIEHLLQPLPSQYHRWLREPPLPAAAPEILQFFAIADPCLVPSWIAIQPGHKQ